MPFTDPWQTKLGKKLRTFIVVDAEIKQLLGAQFHEGELAGLKRKTYPIGTFSIESATGDLDAFNGTIRLWVWSSQNSDEARAIFLRIDTLLDHARLEDEGLVTVYESNGDSIKDFNREFQLHLQTGTFKFNSFHLRKA